MIIGVQLISDVGNTADNDVVEVDGPPPQVGKSTLEKRARVADENAKNLRKLLKQEYAVRNILHSGN